MKIKKIFLISILFLGGIFYFHFCLAQTVSLTPSTQEVEKNTSFSLTLNVSSVSNLFGMAFDLDFNSSLVSFVSANEGTFLSAGCQTSLMTNENPAGKLIVGLSRLGACCGGVSGSGSLMTFNFNSLEQAGTNNFSFSNNSLCLLDGSSCNYVTGTWQGASVTIGGTTPSDTIPPSAPTNLTATAVSSSQINLSWTASTDNLGVTGYRIFRNGAEIATTANTAYSNTGLQANTTYTYQVSAYDAAGNQSSQSSQASATSQSAYSSADLSQDGYVNSVDFGILMSYWGSSSRPAADLNQDGYVNSVDFGIMMSQWG